MVAVLGPGMHLMRRLGITGKFVAIGLLLLLPLGVHVGAGWDVASAQLSLNARERQGLRLATPLVRVLADLTEVETGEAAAGTAMLTAAVAELDAAWADPDALTAGTGAWTSRWAPVRAAVLQAAARAGEATPERTVLAARARQQASALLQWVAEHSGLAVDPSLDSHHLVTTLVQRLPALVATAVDCEQARDGATQPSGTGLAICRHDLQQTSDELRAEVTSAGATAPAGLGRGLDPAVQVLAGAVADYTTTLGSPPPAGRDLHDVASASASTADAVGHSLDTLLQVRHEQLAQDRLRPLLFTLLALLAAGYLVTALYRATARDVRTVLQDINTVTNGALNQTPPLGGRDEFAQMSRAVVHARDRLTALLGALRLRAMHDELTSLGNRTLLAEKLEERLVERSGPVAVLQLDLHRFTDVNDSFGHDIGDRVLRTTAARLHRHAGRRNVAVRLGADEFAVLVTDAGGAADVHRLADRLRAVLEEPVDVDGRRLRVQVAIGAAVHDPGSVPDGPGPVRDDPGMAARIGAQDLLRQAAAALSAARADNRAGTAFFEPAMQQATRERTELSADLVLAVEQGQLCVLYQPIVDLEDGALRGVEALVRWIHPTRGPIPPDTFVPLAETTGLIVPLGRWVLREAVLQLAAWHREFPQGPALTLDVNLSADQLADAGLPGELLSLLDATGVEPSRLVLEITESALVRDLDAARQRLGQLSATGVRVALDDFGTGYSSLSYLRDLPVCVLKMDKSFVEGIEDPDGRAGRLLHSVVDLGADLGMQIIAEGVETDAQRQALRRYGCPLGQGYLWSRPLPAEAVADLLRGADPGGGQAAAGSGGGHAPAGTPRVPRARG